MNGDYGIVTTDEGVVSRKAVKLILIKAEHHSNNIIQLAMAGRWTFLFI